MLVKKGNLNENIPSSMPQEFIEELVNNNKVRIERIVSKGHCSPGDGWYDQDDNEWVMLLEGEALLVFEDNQQKVSLEKGDYVHIEAHKKHRVEWTKPNINTIWLAVFY